MPDDREVDKMSTPVKYDLKTKKISLIFTVITAVTVVLGIVGMFVLDEPIANMDSTKTLLAMIAVFLLYTGIPSFLISLSVFVASAVYTGRLRKNGFEVPYSKKECKNRLENVTRSGDVVNNRYSSDSRIALIVFLILWAACIAGNAAYLVKWIGYGFGEQAAALFVLICIASVVMPVSGFIFFRQRSTSKYIDNVDIKDGRKVRFSILTLCSWALICAAAMTFAIIEAESMTRYVYKSKYGHYEKTHTDFLDGATLNVTSDNLNNGKWDSLITNTAGGDNLSPQITFDEVPGASYYVIYMVDESANNWVHWYASGVTDTSLETGANRSHEGDAGFRYIGPYPPAGSGVHTYTVYVYALSGDPGITFEGGIGFDKPSLSGDLFYYDSLNVTDSSENPYRYGNVIAYGYLSGTYSSD